MDRIELEKLIDEKVATGSVMDEDTKAALLASVSSEIEKAVGPVNKRIDLMVDEEDKKDPYNGFKSMGEFAKAVHTSDTSRGRVHDKRLDKAAGDGMTEVDAASLGHLIPTGFSNELMVAALDNADLFSMARSIPLDVNNVDVPYVDGFNRSGGLVSGGFKWYWVEEEELKTETKAKVGKVKLSLNEMAGLCFVSDPLLQDSPSTVGKIINDGFKDGFDLATSEAIIRGTGAGQPLGILSAPSIISIGIEGGQDDDTFVYENAIKMYYRNWKPANGVWIMNHDVLGQLPLMNIAVGTGGAPAFIPANGAADAPLGRLLGRPIVISDSCSTLGTQGDVIFADMNEYWVGVKSGNGAGIQAASSIHLKFDYDQVAYRFTFRIDGMPWWPSVLTPRRGSTRSAFIVLDSHT